MYKKIRPTLLLFFWVCCISGPFAPTSLWDVGSLIMNSTNVPQAEGHALAHIF